MTGEAAIATQGRPAMSRHDKDFDFDPVPGLPERLPAGEEILWQGRPEALTLAREALV